MIAPAAKLGAIIEASRYWPKKNRLTSRRASSGLLVRSSCCCCGQARIDHDPQQRQVNKQQHERPRHPQVDQQLALQDGVFEEIHCRPQYFRGRTFPARGSAGPESQEAFGVGLIVGAAAFHAGDRFVVEAVRAGAAARP